MQVNSPKLYNLNSRPNISNNLNNEKLNYHISFGGSKDVFVKPAENVIEELYLHSSKKLCEVFSRKAGDFPKGLNLAFSQVNGSLLTYSKELGDNVTVRAIKKVAEHKGKKYPYVIFKEFKNGTQTDIFAVDINSGKLIKLKKDGKLSILKNDFVQYKPDTVNAKYKQHINNIRKYAAAIFEETELQPQISIETATNHSGTANQKKVWRIENASYANLPKSLQKDVKEINELLLRYSDLISARRGLSSKIVKLKEQYDPLIYTSKKQKNTVFKFKNLESVSVQHQKSNPKFTRIIHTNSNGIETHLLIEDAQKVVSNLNKKRPWIIPEKYRYMTKEEMRNSGIEKYIQFLKKQLMEYYDYMNKNLGGSEIIHRNKGFKSEAELTSYIEEISKKIEANIHNIKEEMEKHAQQTASETVSQYFKILSENLDTYTNENLSVFKKKFKTFLEKFPLNVKESS